MAIVVTAFVNIKATEQRLVLQRCTEREANLLGYTEEPLSEVKGVPSRFWQNSATSAWMFFPQPDPALCSVDVQEKSL